MAQATISGADLYYDDQGSGEPLLFHYGYTGSNDEWRGMVAVPLAKYRSIVVAGQGAE